MVSSGERPKTGTLGVVASVTSARSSNRRLEFGIKIDPTRAAMRPAPGTITLTIDK